MYNGISSSNLSPIPVFQRSGRRVVLGAGRMLVDEVEVD